MQTELLVDAPPATKAHSTSLHSTTKRTRTPAVATSEYLTFRLGAEEYAIDILRVQEIRGVISPTRIAQAAPIITGVVDLRGVIVPIVDLRLAFGLQAVNDAATVTIILNIAERVIGVTVDAVADVVSLDTASILPPPDFAAETTEGAVIGLASLGEGDQRRTLIVTDIQTLMAGPQLGLF
ncbi:chemotaxis protein CheW [Aquincola tertiaricarbonis]|uniref:chemotaxis protein CheW n=1 Tax=Aquincola tertiaricarbonis TaxID=391953 RepID=UPI000614CEA2|nr:chemotaxis protein CheW [Aquincola tertiaricarbonis]